MRGKQWFFYFTPLCVGITPADAGKTNLRWATYSEQKDHPRGCGENYKQSLTRCRRLGSPPRMRGKPRSITGNRHTDRITPADAGKTRSLAANYHVDRDHPRGCGENLPTIIIEIVKSGSPPRMRGKRTHAGYRPRGVRITPADAGKTAFQAVRKFLIKDHPRGCGENG